MSSRWIAVSVSTAALVAGLSLALPAVGQAQRGRGERRSQPSTPAPQSQAAGQPYAPPRTPDGQPNLQGVWRVWNLAKYDIEDHSARPGIPAGRGVVVDPPDGKIPYRPEMLAQRKENYDKSRTSDPWKSADPVAKCYNPGVPRLTYLGWPFEIVQTPKYVAIVYEWMHQRRLIYFDPAGRMKGVDFWLGDSRGHWEGNTLVVDVANFNDRTWFDSVGNFHGADMRITEKYIPTSQDTLRYEVTVEDPKTFTRPWIMAMPIQRQKDVGILDYECHALLEEQGIPITWPREP